MVKMKMNEIEIRSSKFCDARKLVIILHGYGNSGSDYVKPIENFFADEIEDAIFLLPNAPTPCETWTGRQWFSLTLEGMTYEEIRHGLHEATPILTEYINKKVAVYNCENVLLIGISQGAFMALEMIYYVNIAGVVSYCGLFIRNKEKHLVSKPKILLIHSDNDKIVPYTYAQEAKTDLEELELDVELKTYQHLGHSISTDEWRYGASVMRKW